MCLDHHLCFNKGSWETCQAGSQYWFFEFSVFFSVSLLAAPASNVASSTTTALAKTIQTNSCPCFQLRDYCWGAAAPKLRMTKGVVVVVVILLHIKTSLTKRNAHLWDRDMREKTLSSSKHLFMINTFTRCPKNKMKSWVKHPTHPILYFKAFLT